MKSGIILTELIAIAFFSFESCTKNNNNNKAVIITDTDLTSNLTTAVAVVATTQLFKASNADIQSVSVTNFDSIKHHHSSNYLGLTGGMMKFKIPHISSCATVTVSSTTYPKTIIINYGSGCTDDKGSKISGKIIITISDTLITAGSEKTITYQDFMIDSMNIEYTGTIKNMGKNVNGDWIISDNYVQKTTGRNGDVVIETYSDSMEWVSGFTTTDKSDDVYYKTGSGSVVVNDTLKYRRTITKPLLHDNSCKYIKSGTIVLIKGTDTIITDYGDRTCDAVATVTTNGTTETIDLSTYRFSDNRRFDQHCKGGSHHGTNKGTKYGF